MPAAAEPEALPALPTLALLTPAQRQALPPLRLSMHVYDARAEARFVLIDGKRLRQGDLIADDLLLEQIRSDGAVILHGAQRFLLPRP